MTELDIPLRALDSCFDGGVPATLTTCSREGVPNISFLSVVHRVDDHHVALSFQFFRKTKENLAENPRAGLLVIEPNTGAEYRLELEFVRTEVEGPVFERLSSSIAGIASQTGMVGVFQLRGADIYRVNACERCPNGVEMVLPAPRRADLSAIAGCVAAMAQCTELEELLHVALRELDESLGYRHGFILAADLGEASLYSVASRGYSPSGIGAEIPLGTGLIGQAAERRALLRVANLSRERIFAEALRTTEAAGVDPCREIPLPGLAGAESMLVVPLIAEEHLMGILCLQSLRAADFGRDDEDVATIIASQLALGMARLGCSDEDGNEPVAKAAVSSDGEVAEIRYYEEDDSIFIDGDYIIKGVAGRILWLLLDSYTQEGRRHFSNKELRLNGRLRLPPVKDNLESRLIMLRRRLEEKGSLLRICRTGRGLFALEVEGPLQLLTMTSPGAST